tara:strand:- start:39 stop:233 length:195 start_codon:yes stop_codon:yes gene_type:complete
MPILRKNQQLRYDHLYRYIEQCVQEILRLNEELNRQKRTNDHNSDYITTLENRIDVLENLLARP